LCTLTGLKRKMGNDSTTKQAGRLFRRLAAHQSKKRALLRPLSISRFNRIDR
jgi:hypothetical protein